MSASSQILWGSPLAQQSKRARRVTSPRSLAHPSAHANLSPRQMQCAERIAAGMSNPQIAEELRLNPGTVKVYVSSLYDAVGVKTRLELLIWFRDRFGRSMDRRGARK